MNVFIIWSGKTSKAIAEAFRDWLPQVIQEVEPWMSGKDIDKGAHWPTELAESLEKVNFGIVCLTPDNREAPWILFESGATSKAVGKAHVSPYLFGLKSTDLTVKPTDNRRQQKATTEGVKPRLLTDLLISIP